MGEVGKKTKHKSTQDHSWKKRCDENKEGTVIETKFWVGFVRVVRGGLQMEVAFKLRPEAGGWLWNLQGNRLKSGSGTW